MIAKHLHEENLHLLDILALLVAGHGSSLYSWFHHDWHSRHRTSSIGNTYSRCHVNHHKVRRKNVNTRHKYFKLNIKVKYNQSKVN